MPVSFEPRWTLFPNRKQRLWPELDQVLDGGAALALQLGHRVSEDSDFFSSVGFDSDRLRSTLLFFRGVNLADPRIWVHRKRDDLEVFLNFGGGAVKVAFFGGLDPLQRGERSAPSVRFQGPSGRRSPHWPVLPVTIYPRPLADEWQYLPLSDSLPQSHAGSSRRFLDALQRPAQLAQRDDLFSLRSRHCSLGGG